MPHQSLKLIPGVDSNRTPALNEAGVSDGNLIRFFYDKQGMSRPQKLGGWSKFFAQPVGESISSLWAWADTNSDNHLGIGADDNLYSIENDTLSVRSPQFYAITRAVSATTTSGSATITINDTASNVLSVDHVWIKVPIAVGGIVLFGLYACTANSANSFNIQSVDILQNPAYATSSVASGGVVATYTTTAASPIVTVTLANHGFQVGSTYAALIDTSVGGTTVPTGNYFVQSVPSTSTFTIIVPVAASSGATVSMNNGNALYEYYLGKQELPSAVGYGAGGYGAGGYGIGTSVTGGRAFTTTAATAVGTTATLSFGVDCLIEVGSTIVVSGVTPTGFNGTWTVTGSTNGATSTVSFNTAPATLSGPQTVAGTITVKKWAFPGTTDWSLSNWGENLIASFQDGPIFSWSPTGDGSTSGIITNCPTHNHGTFVAMPQRQIIAYGSTFNGIGDPLLVRWCDVNNYFSWIGKPTNQAGSFRISTGSKIVGAIQGPQQGYIFTDVGVWSMQYVGQPNVYSINEIGTGCGLVGKKAVVKMGTGVYWMSQNQFWRAVGSGLEQVPCDVWNYVFQQVDTDHYDSICAAANSQFNEVTWYFPVSGSGGVNQLYVKYNINLNVWDYGTLTRTAWIDQSVLGPPLGASDNSYIYQHETSNDADGDAMVSYFQTGYFTLADGDVLTFVDQVWPDMQWGVTGGSADADVEITFYVAEYPGQTPKEYGPYTVTQATTYITPRFRGRLVSIKIGTSDVASFWRLGNIRYRAQPDGKFL